MMDFRKLSFPVAPVIKIVPPGPESKQYLDYQVLSESSAVSYPKGLPMAIRRAKGSTVEDVDGNIYIDFFGGAGVMAVGHSNPQVINAASEQITELTHSLDVPNPARRLLVESLLTVLPSSLNKLFFGGPTGSDAVEAAMKLAKYNNKRYPMIAFEGAYHGMTSGALSLSSGLAFKEDFLPLVSEVHFIPYAYCYRCAFGKKPDSCDLDCARYLEHILEDPHSGIGMPSALVVEAIQGEGGTIVPPDGFLSQLREICSKYGVFMIVDEIQAGLCRTGKFFAFEHSGTLPDIVTMSKALGGVGFPISCVAYKDELDIWPPGKHIGTFRGNAVAYAAGHAALQFMIENRLAEYASQMGGNMLERLKGIERDSEVVGEARGKGLMFGIEIVHDKASKDPAPELAQKIRTLCHRRGLLVEIGGHYNNVVRFLPPLILTEDLAQKGIEIFADAVRESEKSR
jgi:diaminobutyrate-2-oxoglutarate transaminase